ncbi:MAG: NAD(P)H-dependent oxidoreductase [Promethearchaeota archaeon]
MKILIILGSPRNKNTYKLTQLLEEQLRADIQIVVEYLFLKELALDYCRGCHTCLRFDEEKCPHYKVTASLKEIMDQADGIIFAYPSYMSNLPALMKNFIDHFAYLQHRPCYFEKKSLILTTSQGSGLKQSRKYMEFVVKSWGFHVVGTIEVKMLAYERSEKYQLNVKKQIQRLSTQFINALLTQKLHIPSISQLIDFHVWRLIVTSTRNGYPRDYEYWEKMEWLSKEYYNDVSINPIKKRLAKFLFNTAKPLIKRNYKL